MERLTHKNELGIDINKIKDCPTHSICWDCDYRVKDCEYFNDAIEKLAKYEDLEEQGKLLKLPCKIGDNIYVLEDVYGIGEFEITEYRIEAMRTEDNFSLTFDALEDEECLEVTFESLDIGKTVFLTKEEAEKALERLECAE